MLNNRSLHPHNLLFGVPSQCLSFYRRPGGIWRLHLNLAASHHPLILVSKISANGIERWMTRASISYALVFSLL